LHENSDLLLSNDRDVYETVLASERLEALDVRKFTSSGILETNVPIDELRARASSELGAFCRDLSNGGKEMIAYHRHPHYAALLYMTIL
jgi:hypothetical protein